MQRLLSLIDMTKSEHLFFNI